MRAWVALVALAVLGAGAAGCARVKPWQRETLSKPAMTPGRGRAEGRFNQHARGAREASEGGYGEAGGGCGCN